MMGLARRRRSRRRRYALPLALLAAVFAVNAAVDQPVHEPGDAPPAMPSPVPVTAVGPGAAARPAAAAAPDTGLPPGVPADVQRAVVEHIVDGDTIWVRVDDPGGPLVANATHKIRLLEIDTPETRDPERGVQCGGPEATAFAEDRLPVGSTVYLQTDEENTDRYGRFLRYVWTEDGTLFNREAVLAGHARASLYEPNDRHIAAIRQAEAVAKTERRGIWGDPCRADGWGSGADASRSAAGDPPAAAPPAAQPLVDTGASCEPGYDPCVPRYPPDVNCSALTGPYTVTGPDPHHLDGDGDGIGCQG